MLCSRCGKNIAVVFLGDGNNPSAPAQALCVTCARELGIPQVDKMIQQLGLDPDEIEKEMSALMENMDGMDLGELENMNPMEMMEKLLGESGTGDAPAAESVQEYKKDSKKKNKDKPKFLEEYSVNLTKKARNGEIDRVIGRNTEIARVIRVLNRRNKNNPVLIGEPGVGKTAIAEGLALRIEEKDVPAKLFGYEVFLVDFAALVAGTQFRGQFEARLKKLIEEVKARGNAILFIDEIHNIVGAGDTEGGAMSAANILKPALARGDIQVIGATTLDEYRRKIEKDPALERRFQPVFVDEPSVMDSIEILKGIKDYYEKYHEVSISDEVIKSSVLLSERYIQDRFLPDKAIDVIDEAASKVNLENRVLIDIKLIDEKLKALELQRQEIDAEDYEKAAELKKLECQYNEELVRLNGGEKIKPVTVDDVAEVIEMWTKIPVHKLTEVDSKKLSELEENLHKRVIGQNKAVEEVARAVRRKRAGIEVKRKPVSFIFAGPTGVGKTELVKALAECVFGSEEALIRVDMSEYMEKHSVSKLIGSPPGYVGYDEAGQLTERVRRNPYSVILLDEIEKAHEDVFNIFLQVLDDGRITDSQGRVINFENTIIVMTTNAGSQLSAGNMGFESESGESRYEKVLSQMFRPEFINRIDEIVEFAYLEKDELLQIVSLMLHDLVKGLAEKGITADITDAAKALVVEKGYKRKFGARPMRRIIMKHIEDEIAKLIISGALADANRITVDAADDEFVLKYE